MPTLVVRANVRVALLITAIFVALAACTATRSPGLSFGIRASQQPSVIERGRYLVRGPAHCAACHGDPARESEMRAGEEVPLSGGKVFDLGVLGSIVAPNITSDPDSGIGALSDDTLVRSLRYGISRHGKPLAPFMSFADLADADLEAILSFLRAQPPVARPTPASHLSWLGTIGIGLILDPQQPVTMPPARSTPERTPEYGRYLAHTVANCHGCHTLRSRMTGAFIGPAFAGGMKLREPAGTFVSANLTPAASGPMHDYTEAQFIARFRAAGGGRFASPMPWAAFARMTDTDLGAIYLYLKSLPPAEMPQG